MGRRTTFGTAAPPTGALCSSTAHTALVPLDVLKTRLQADAALGSPVDAAQTIWRADDDAAFLTGGVETFTGYLLAGSLSLGLTESFRRLLRGVLGAGNGLLLAADPHPVERRRRRDLHRRRLPI